MPTEQQKTPSDDHQEILTLNLGGKVLWKVIVPHPQYTIEATGFIRYRGNSSWEVDKITFPVECVKRIDKTFRVIYLR